jgi:hypothetical protein
MNHWLFATTFLAMAVTVPASANSRIKIGTIPSQYTPYLSIVHEPVSLRTFHFEIDEGTGRARVVAAYTYKENMIAGADDGGGPQSTVVQLPGLVYDARDHAVVYNSDGRRTICAVVRESRRLWSHHSNVINTGACTVSTERANITVDDGWTLRQLSVINTYFEVQQPPQ